jgi:hypothetical protein
VQAQASFAVNDFNPLLRILAAKIAVIFCKMGTLNNSLIKVNPHH